MNYAIYLLLIFHEIMFKNKINSTIINYLFVSFLSQMIKYISRHLFTQNYCKIQSNYQVHIDFKFPKSIVKDARVIHNYVQSTKSRNSFSECVCN